MITQYTLRTMAMTVQETLIVLYKCVAKLGCGMIGYDLEIDYGRTTKSR
jgi:hypothetical protein